MLSFIRIESLYILLEVLIFQLDQSILVVIVVDRLPRLYAGDPKGCVFLLGNLSLVELVLFLRIIVLLGNTDVANVALYHHRVVVMVVFLPQFLFQLVLTSQRDLWWGAWGSSKHFDSCLDVWHRHIVNLDELVFLLLLLRLTFFPSSFSVMEFREQFLPDYLSILLLAIVVFLLLLHILLNVEVLGEVDVWIVIVDDCYSQRWVQFLLSNQRVHFNYSLACCGTSIIRHYNLSLHVTLWSNLERFGRNLVRHCITFFLIT